MKTLFTIVLLLISTITYARVDTLTIRLSSGTGDDAPVFSNLAPYNYNIHSDIVAARWTNGQTLTGRTYFRFNLNSIPANAIILDAKLSLYANPYPDNASTNSNGSNQTKIRRVQSNWTATGITWNNQPAYTTLHEVTLPSTSNPSQDYPNINMTQLYQDQLSDPQHSFGFVLMLADETLMYNCMNFASGDCIDFNKRPVLTIIYDTPTSITQNTSEIPSKFSLHQNFPNPFNPSTNIKFDLAKSSTVKLTVFDALGREVAKLVDENMSAGSYTKSFDASSLQSGIYFFRLQTESFTETQKMSLIK